MNIKILCVGKIKEKFYRDAIAEYVKRLSRYCKLSIVEVADEKTPDRSSDAEENQIREREAARLLAQIRDTDHVIALAIDGKTYDSPGLAGHLEQLAVSGKSSLTFVIGGSLGLDTSVLARANERLSFSAMTFPHQLMRVILLEQVYRSFRIINHEPYHK
jgi:23S rRNA (pseudouridine1915-N3)-methyltransferase